jgi:predicted metalloprotease with PDZ domain
MQALWARHGRPGQKEPGLVATPYTMIDLQQVLGEVSGDKAFAEAFFSRYVRGHDVLDYAPLLARAGLMLRPQAPGAAYFRGALELSFDAGGARVTTPAIFDSALYRSGVERDDLIVSIDGIALDSREALQRVLGKHKPGDQVPMRYVRRSGEPVNTTLTLQADLRKEIVTIESTGGTLTGEQKRFREAWLGSRVATK